MVPRTAGRPLVMVHVLVSMTACRGGDADPPPDPGASSIVDTAPSRETDPGVPSVVLDPTDEEFDRAVLLEKDGDGEDGDGDSGDGTARGSEYTVKGVVRAVDPVSGLVVIEQLLADGKRHDVRFWTDDETAIGWSKASMEMTLEELRPGSSVFVTYYVTGKHGQRRNRAVAIVLPGGMEDVAKMILGEHEG